MLSTHEAERVIRQHLPAAHSELQPLGRCAGRVLAEDVYAERDQPPFDRVAMDGIALDSAAVRAGTHRFVLQASQPAGKPALTLESVTACIEVATGSILPVGCDAVVPREHLELAHGAAQIAYPDAAEPFRNVHRRGSDRREGELLLPIGTRLMAAEIAIAASAGKAELRVAKQPRIAVLSTGDELIEPGEPILPHQVRRSNAHGVVAALHVRGFEHVTLDHAADNTDDLRVKLRRMLETHSVLILSGGVSVGNFDLVPSVLTELGVRELFHGVKQRPGKPFWFGRSEAGASVFALPGNPVATFVCLARYVMPALLAAMGHNPPAPELVTLGAPVTIGHKLIALVPVSVEQDAAGKTVAAVHSTNGSGDLTALAGTDGIIELSAGPQTYPKDYVAPLYRW